MNRMVRKPIVFSVILAISMISQSAAHAVFYDLTDEQITQAVEYGQKNKDHDYVFFLAEWVSTSKDWYEWAAINTKFSIVAYESKNAALAGKTLTDEEITQFMFEAEGIFSFQVVLYGSSPDFTKDYHAVLLYGDKPIQPVLEQNDMNAKMMNIGLRKPSYYRAICRYDFPNYFVDPNAEVILVIISPLHKERRFFFNLGGIR
ncbi:MAG: hypothetical protein FJ264_12615 [Planctomycetes bacterium]|nr:hypothetical protein [Planctomycetota bacterium]